MNKVHRNKQKKTMNEYLEPFTIYMYAIAPNDYSCPRMRTHDTTAIMISEISAFCLINYSQNLHILAHRRLWTF